jgi:hypothetical protein
MACVLFNFFHNSLGQHTATAPQKDEAEFAAHLQAADGADVGSTAFTNGAFCVFRSYIRWVLHQF